MTLEIILDILLSAVVLYVYHSDCKPAPAGKRSSAAKTLQEFKVLAIPAEDYEYGCIPEPAAVDEWLLDADEPNIVTLYTDIVAAIDTAIPGNALTGSQASLYDREQLQSCSVKVLRLMAKAVGIKNCSRLSKVGLVEALAIVYGC